MTYPTFTTDSITEELERLVRSEERKALNDAADKEEALARVLTDSYKGVVARNAILLRRKAELSYSF